MTRIDKAVEALHGANAKMWIVCLVAGRTVRVRKGVDGVVVVADANTEELAQRLLRSASQLQNYAHAYHGYKLSRKHTYRFFTSLLSPGHYAVIFTTWREIEYDPELTLDYLTAAIADGLNAEELREVIENDNNVQPKPVTLGDKFFQKAWDWTETIADLQIRLRAQELLREFQKIAKGTP